MTTQESYEGWTNRETWAVALHVNNDQGWQESVHEALRELSQPSAGRVTADEPVPFYLASPQTQARLAGEIICENVENTLVCDDADLEAWYARYYPAAYDIGSLWRVDWTELGASFLADLAEQDDPSKPPPKCQTCGGRHLPSEAHGNAEARA